MRLLKTTLAAAVAMTLLGSVVGQSPALAEYSQSPSFSWVPNGGSSANAVYSIAQSGDVIYIGGNFTSLSNPKTHAVATRDHLAALDANTGELLAWNPDADGVVRSLATAPDGTVYVGGDFASIGGVPATRLAAVSPDGVVQPGFRASADKTVRQIRVDGPDLYVAGDFTHVDGVARIGVAKVAADDGVLDSAWDAHLYGGRVRALGFTNLGDLVIGGTFTKINGRAQSFLGRVSKTTGSDSGWAPKAACANCQVLDIDVDGNWIYTAMGGTGGRAAAYYRTGGQARWVKKADGDVQSIDAINGTVYAGGHFGPTFLGEPRDQLVALSASDGALLPFSPSFRTNYHPGTWDLLATDSRLYVGGGFRMTSGPYARYGSFAIAP